MQVRLAVLILFVVGFIAGGLAMNLYRFAAMVSARR